jgi:hypothetical protein
MAQGPGDRWLGPCVEFRMLVLEGDHYLKYTNLRAWT